MDYIRINKLITTSIYKQIATSITDAIDHGILMYGDKLPTERELCEAFSISATAVKMAYETLIKSGKIKRIKGKGTFVTNRRTHHAGLHTFFNVSANGGRIVRETILMERIFKDYSVYRVMKIDSGEKCYKIMSIFKNQENPVLLQVIYLPERYFPNFSPSQFQSQTLYRFFEENIGQEIKHLHSTFNAINASSAEALLLNISPDDAIYFVRTQVVDDANRIVAYIRNYFPGEFTEFEVSVNAV